VPGAAGGYCNQYVDAHVSLLKKRIPSRDYGLNSQTAHTSIPISNSLYLTNLVAARIRNIMAMVLKSGVERAFGLGCGWSRKSKCRWMAGTSFSVTEWDFDPVSRQFGRHPTRHRGQA
jgi:hypothetical protein